MDTTLIPSQMTDFEKQVLADLSELKTNMHWLVGNGQPGWIQRLSARVDRHESLLQRAGGIGAAILTGLTLVHLAIDYMKWKR
ncbi:MAG TPA: hypothetical protein VG892_02840 [Terriglobales bacterium]|nr:hypothetical protein [Terriglobales bacterium]